ncbi:hypothetical protein [Paenibacillus sp. GP183]|uniref:hypothetical protein n=1 Tax=Paenibacillus sp. GP183 TaxID=1882751 RepID=UPI00089932BC|nr:hypothetical protein [Paenibacillus sp. GP183]SEC18188.1 hypothetical protein SAMN05443246_3249 [Paenibacillus sp. GP183]
MLIDEESNKYRIIESIEYLKTSPNRAIIMGVIEGLKTLKYPCDVKIYSKIPIGVKRKMYKKNKGPNGDLLEELRIIIEHSHHHIDFIVDIPQVETYVSKYILLRS